MSFDSLLIHDLVIKRMAATGAYTERQQPVTAEAAVASVRGLIQPKTADEMALASQAGVPVGDHVGFLRPLAGLGQECWIERGTTRYDIVGIRDAAGRGHHLELDLRRVG